LKVFGKIYLIWDPSQKGSYADVIKGPGLRLKRTDRPLEIENGLVDELLAARIQVANA